VPLIRQNLKTINLKMKKFDFATKDIVSVRFRFSWIQKWVWISISKYTKYKWSLSEWNHPTQWRSFPFY